MTSKDGASRATIADVARLSGVSTGTVSRVINGRSGVHPRTRQQVLAAIEQLDFRPDSAARALSARQPVRIGLNVASGIRRLTPFSMLILECLMVEFNSDGFLVEEVPNGPDGLPKRLPDALVLLGAHDDDPRIAYLREREIPFVLVGHAEGASWVVSDDRDGGYQATAHLLRLGHERIAHLSGLMHNQAFVDRFEGYLAALRGLGVEHDPSLLLDGEFTTLGGYRAVRRALERELEFTALFAASDEMAVGAIAALEDAGRRVPLDVSVVGFDDLPEVGENLTTVRQDIPRLAASAVATLKTVMSGGGPSCEVVPVQLVSRGTTSRRR